MTRRTARRASIIAAGALLLLAVATAGYVLVNDESRQRLILAVVPFLLGLLAAIVALWLNSDSLTYVRRSDIRKTKPSALFFWRSSRQSRPEFFRAPACFVDFQKDAIIRHPELDRILSAIRTERRGAILVEGPPAAGKSIFLQNLEYDLRSGFLRRRVYKVACKNLLEEHVDEACAEIQDKIPAGSIILIDDLHLQLLEVTNAIVAARTRDLLFVVTTRPLSNYPVAQWESIKSCEVARVHTTAQDVSASMVRRYLTAKGVCTKANIAQFHGYEHDLWILSAALESAEIGQGQVAVSIARLRDWIAAKLIGPDKPSGAAGRRSIMIILACMYRYEVTVETSYLIDAGIADDDLSALRMSGDVLGVGSAIRLHHSSLAELILSTTQALLSSAPLPSAVARLSARQRASACGPSWMDRLVADYVSTTPAVGAGVLVQVSLSSEKGMSLATGILRRTDPRKMLEEGVSHGGLPLESFGTFARVWGASGFRHRKVLSSVLRMYIDRGDERDMANPIALAWAVANLAKLDQAEAAILLPHLAELLPSCRIEDAARIATDLSYVSIDLARDAVAHLKSPSVADALMNMDAFARAMCLAKLVWVLEDLGKDMCNWSDFIAGARPESISQLLARVAWGNPHYASDLVESATVEGLAELVLHQPSFGKSTELLGLIANVNHAVGVNVAVASRLRSSLPNRRPLSGEEHCVLDWIQQGSRDFMIETI